MTEGDNLSNETWTGSDLAEFLDEHELSPEQVATALRRQPLTIRNWMKNEGPFAGNDDDSHVMRLAILGMLADASALAPSAGAPPLTITLHVHPNDRVEASKKRMVRPRRSRGTGQKPGPDFADLP